MHSCSWAAEHLNKDEGDFKRNIQNMEVPKIQTIFETVQVQISNFQPCDHEVYGLRTRGLDWWYLERLFVAAQQNCHSIQFESFCIQ